MQALGEIRPDSLNPKKKLDARQHAHLAAVVKGVQRGRLQRALELGRHDVACALAAPRVLPHLRVRLRATSQAFNDGAISTNA